MAADEMTNFAGTQPASGTGRRAVTAFFDDRAAAQAAIDDVIAAGVDRNCVTLVEGGAEPVAHEAVPSDRKGFWQSFKELFMAEEDRHAYGEGLRRGGFLVSVDTSDGEHDRIVDLLDRDGAVDIDARQADWTLEGWDPRRAAADLASSADAGAALGTPAPRAAAPISDPQRVTPAPAQPSATVGPTVIRDPGATSSRLRTYVDSPVRRDPGEEPSRGPR